MLCFGDNNAGQLGLKEALMAPYPQEVLLPFSIQKVVCGSYKTLVLTREGALLCSGPQTKKHFAQVVLPLDPDDVIVDFGSTANEIAVVTKKHVMKSYDTQHSWTTLHLADEDQDIGSIVSCCGGAFFFVFLGQNGSVYTCGLNSYGTLGTGNTDQLMEATPLHRVLLPGGDPVVAICCGSCHALALTAAGDVYGWGRNDYLQVSEGAPECMPTPARLILPFNKASFIAAGDNHSLLISASDGQLYGCGFARYGQLGVWKEGMPEKRGISIIELPTKKKVIRVATGGGHCTAHTVAIAEDGVYAFGINNASQLGYPRNAADGENSLHAPAFVMLPAHTVAQCDDFSRWGVSCGCRHTVIWYSASSTCSSDFRVALRTKTTPKGVGGLPEEVRHNVLGYLWGAAGGHVRDVLSVGLMNRSWERTVRMSSHWRNMLSGVLLERVQRDGASMERICWKDAYLSTRGTAFSAVTNYNPKKADRTYVGYAKGLFSGLRRKGDARLMMLGPSAGGKTALLYSLRLGKRITLIPTVGFNVETITHKGVPLVLWDISGTALWRFYASGTHAVIFVIDASRRDLLPEAVALLQQLDNDILIQELPILIFANKQDLPGVLTPQEVAAYIDAFQWNNRRWCVQGCSVNQEKGLTEGLDWIVEALRPS